MTQALTESAARKRIRAYIVDMFLYMRPDFQFTDDDSLLRKGVFDSLGVTEVIQFLEENWGIEVPEDDVTEANFGTLAGIARYVVGAASGNGRA
jgi:acyl carrier protein